MSKSSFCFTDDLVFRAFLSADRMKSSLMGLLNSILREAVLPQIRDLTIKNPFLLETWENEKEPILDIRVVDEEAREYDVEMQCRREEYYVGRVVTYTFRLHVEQLERGNGYDWLKRTVGISLTTFPIDSERPDLWFDVWKYNSVLGSGLGYDEVVNIFVRLPSKRGEVPVGIKDPELLNWITLLAFYPNLSDEEIARIGQTTAGAAELCQEAEMFIGSKQDHELMQARERYWHDQASMRAGYEKKLRIMAAEKDSAIAEKNLVIAERVIAERDSIAQTLQLRFNVPVATTLARLNKIDSAEELHKLLNFGFKCRDYDDFLANLSNTAAES